MANSSNESLCIVCQLNLSESTCDVSILRLAYEHPLCKEQGKCIVL